MIREISSTHAWVDFFGLKKDFRVILLFNFNQLSDCSYDLVKKKKKESLKLLRFSSQHKTAAAISIRLVVVVTHYRWGSGWRGLLKRVVILIGSTFWLYGKTLCHLSAKFAGAHKCRAWKRAAIGAPRSLCFLVHQRHHCQRGWQTARQAAAARSRSWWGIRGADSSVKTSGSFDWNTNHRIWKKPFGETAPGGPSAPPAARRKARGTLWTLLVVTHPPASCCRAALFLNILSKNNCANTIYSV